MKNSPAAAFFYPNLFIKKGNLLDENVFMYCEEPILAKTLQNKGYKALYVDEVTAYHQHISSQKPSSNAARMIAFLKSRKYYIKNYSGYNSLECILAIFIRNLQLIIWKVKEKYGIHKKNPLMYIGIYWLFYFQEPLFLARQFFSWFLPFTFSY